jgi:hypothetical protein
MFVTLLHDASILCSCHRACLLCHLAKPWQLTSNVLLILPMICTIGMASPFLNLHHPHLYVNLSCKVLLLYLPGQQQPVERNRRAKGVHRNHNALVVGIGMNIVQGG